MMIPLWIGGLLSIATYATGQHDLTTVIGLLLFVYAGVVIMLDND